MRITVTNHYRSVLQNDSRTERLLLLDMWKYQEIEHVVRRSGFPCRIDFLEKGSSFYGKCVNTSGSYYLCSVRETMCCLEMIAETENNE